MGFLPSLARFSVAEWVVALFLLFCAGYLGFYVRNSLWAGERLMVAYRAAMGRGGHLLHGVLPVHTALCGLNYYWHTFAEHAGYDVEEAGVDAAQRQEELVALAASLADELGRTRAQLGDDADLFDVQPGQFWSATRGRSVEAVRKLAEQYPALERPLFAC